MIIDRRIWKGIFLIAFGIALFFFIFNEAFYGGGDFKIYYGAGELFKHKISPYHKWFDVGGGNSMQFSYSPAFLMLFIPFTWLNIKISIFIWLAMNVFFLYRIGKLLIEFLDIKLQFNNRQKVLLLLITALFTLRFIHSTFGMVQVSIFILFACLESIVLINKNKVLSGAVLLAVSVVVKILPLVLLPYLLYRNHIKSFFLTVVIVIILGLLPSLYIGSANNWKWLKEWSSIINPSNKEFLLEQNKLGEGIQSLSAMIPALLSDNAPSKIHLKRNICDLDDSTVILILNICRFVLIGFTLYFLRTFPFKKSISKVTDFWELSYILLIVPLIFPHQQKYAFVMIIPATAYIVYFLIVQFNNIHVKKRHCYPAIILMSLSFILMSLTTDGVIGRHLSVLADYYKLVGYGNILIILSLSICKPNLLGQKINPVVGNNIT
jgi:hypothetical protein